MPQITGFEVLEKLRSGAYKHYKKQPIIAMTGRRDLESEAYTSIGFDQVLQKPFSKKELIAMLKLLGFKTETTMPKTEIDTPDKIATEHYSLEIIHSFLGVNEDAINEVLQTFILDTRTNMQLLEDGIATSDYLQINQVAHRMLPMFRQLKVDVVSTIERLELAQTPTMNTAELEDALHVVKNKVAMLTQEIESRWATSPSYSD